MTSNDPGRLRGRAAERVLAAEQLEAFRAFAQTHTEFLGRLGGLIVNDVLEVGTYLLPTDGYYGFAWRVACGALEVVAHGATDLTVVAAGPGSAAPTIGRGVHVVPAGVGRILNVASRSVTVYGAAGDRFGLQAVTRGGILGAALTAVNGGAP